MTDFDEARRTSFDRQAALYDAARPSYPEALVAEIEAHTSGRRMVEIGAGTGKATALFAGRGYSIVAIEPGANMAAVLRDRALPGVTIEVTTFEAWTGADGSFDLIAAAQAIHWIDPALRYVKTAAALRPGGSLAWLRNERAAIESEIRADLDAAYARWFPEQATDQTGDSVAAARDEYCEQIAHSGLFGSVHVATVPWTATYTTAQYLALLDTYSHHAVLDPSRKRPLYAAIAAAIDQHGGIVVPYVAMAFVAPRL